MISCIIPTRDRWLLLARAVESVRAQGKGVEILVVDDGSTDETANWLPRLRGVRGLRLEGVGPAAARNAGVEAASGEWVAFLDDDDEWLPGKLERQLSYMQSRGLRFCCTAWEAVRPDGRVGRGPARPPDPSDDLRLRLLEGNYCSTPTVLVERKLLIRAGLFDPALRRAEDWDLWLRVAALAPPGYLAEPLTRVHLHDGGQLSDACEEMWRDTVRVQLYHLRDWGSTVPGPWRRRVKRAVADRLVQAAGAAWARGARRRAAFDLLRAAHWSGPYALRALAARAKHLP